MIEKAFPKLMNERNVGPGLGRLAYLPDDFRTFFFSVSTHPVTDESVVGISAAREFAAANFLA